MFHSATEKNLFTWITIPSGGPPRQPGGQDAVEDNGFEVDLFDADGLEVGLVVEPAGRVVVPTAVARRDVERHVQAAGDLVEDLVLELGVGRRRLLRLELAHLPAAGHGHQGPAFQLDRLERLGGVLRFSKGEGNGSRRFASSTPTSLGCAGQRITIQQWSEPSATWPACWLHSRV